MMYVIIPIEDTEYFDLITTYYTEVGYTVTWDTDTLRMEDSFED
ncbi:MAG: hypothetical protein ACTSPG_08410 [Candidatus Hodarchaeales archaeon]